MRNRLLARHATPILALAFCFGVVFGGSVPELGNIAMYYAFEDVIADNFVNFLEGIVGVAHG